MNRRLAIAAFLTLVPAGVIVACSFPTVNVLPLDDGDSGNGNDTGTIDGNSPDAARDAAGDGALPPDVDPEGGIKEAGTVDVVVVDASGGCCDCDMDTYLVDGGACTLDAGIVGFGDCDDSIGALNPGTDFLINDKWPPTAHLPPFDWNCDGVVTKQLNHDLNCAGLLLCGGEGFQGDPACGVETNYFKCAATGFLGACEANSNGTRKQGCK